jgi:hypothetical protein
MRVFVITSLVIIVLSPKFYNIIAQPAEPSRQYQGEGILLILKDCHLTNTNVTCNMQISSRDREQDIQLSIQKSRMTIGGNHYKLLEFQLGGQQPQIRAREHVSPGTPINLTLRFEPIPLATQGFARLELNIFSDRKWRTIPCTNLQIVR